METLINQQKKNLYLVLGIGFIFILLIIFITYFKIPGEYKAAYMLFDSILSILFILISITGLQINKIRRELSRLRNNFAFNEVEAINVSSEFDAGERGSIFTDKIKLHIKSLENKIYCFILNPAQYANVINDLMKRAPSANYFLRVKNLPPDKKTHDINEKLKIQYS